MRDLAARLREIVRRPSGAPPEPPPVRRVETSDPCRVLDSRIEGSRHGRVPMAALDLAADAPVHLFDPRLRADDGWQRRVVFFDIETTGLSGGAGTVAFLAGCGWFDDGAFVVRQFFLASPSGEPEMLDALGDVLRGASLVVTFNGRTFDVPFMEMRWAYHRRSAPTGDLPHLDMLPGARRLWGRRESILDRGDCSLGGLERDVLGFDRGDDVPGIEIPARYFHFLRTGDAAAIDGVLEHNRHDLVSLAALTAHALTLAREGPSACRNAGECLALGRMYDRAGDDVRAADAFARAAEGGGDRDVRRHALARLAAMHRRADRHDEAAGAWQAVLDLAPPGGELSPLDRRAVEALAIHHEHRARDLASAKQYAEVLDRHAAGRGKADADHRLNRIERKLAASRRPLEWD